MADLAEKVVLVTGAAKRVGAEIARRIHGAGGRVGLHYRASRAEAEALAAEFNHRRPGSAVTVGADLGDAPALAAAVARVADHFGRLDGLVNNASSFFPTALGTIGEGEWNELLASNFKGPLFLAQAAAPWLRASRGAIVNITDVHADMPLRGFPVYCAAKAGLAGLTRALALELAPDVRVNAVAPGPIEWPDDGTFDAATRARIIEDTLLKRCGEPADIARTVLFLLSDAPFITGQTIAVDGGRMAHL